MNKNFLKDKRGVFGLTAVQTFFAVILGIALLAYVIVIIMGTLGGTTILPQLTYAGSVTNETGAYINTTGYTLTEASTSGFSSPVLTALYNATAGTAIGLGNATVSAAGVITNTTVTNWNNVSVSYTYNYIANSPQQNDLNSILSNTSTGITGFFSAINPIYAILAVLVIILVLTVLVRVVQAPNSQGQAPQL
jgi:hypothetical protein